VKTAQWDGDLHLLEHLEGVYRRIFSNTSEMVLQVAARIKDGIEQRKRAFAHA
jgi:hypothetical protein